ncbi:hypothetical protein BGZ80_011615 [Entomortierella chlamydospora]|uniref:Uncharacterized protein n=1 Tax=Entomortierella chlamydospora TaxID=101097 RepID=A0A9P6SZ58_9FUNG|nr:hypothetical protein BGZ80_011615 [Entomortierella chlamydospora]
MKETLPGFIADHEFHLKANGSNGHYVGDKVVSRAAIMAEFEKSEELMKVRKAVERNPDIAAWRASDECRKLVQGSIIGYGKSTVPGN